MKNIFKLLGVSATSSKPNDFNRAVLKLTAYYTTGVFLVMLIFSFLVYVSFTVSIRDRFHDAQIDSVQDMLVYNELTENLSHILIVSDSILLLITVIVSYVLSKRTLAPLSEAYETQKRFVANAAHELRTPLAVMKAGSELLLTHERSIDEHQKFLHESLDEINDLIILSNDLLFLAEHNNAAIRERSLVQLDEICRSQCAYIEPYARTKEVHISTSIEEGIVVLGRREDLARLLRNLLKNAVDYNKPNGSVLCSLKKKGESCVLTVKDTGIGMSPEDQERVFERFYKADTARTHVHTVGAGLGLAIVKEIAEAHAGTVNIESVLHEGTTVEIEFSLAA